MAVTDVLLPSERFSTVVYIIVLLSVVVCSTYSSLYILPDTYSDPVIH